MAAPLGINAKMYYRSAGSYNSPTWTELNIVSDLTVSPEWEKAEVGSRASRIMKQVKTRLGLTFAGRFLKKPGNTQYETLMNALVSDEVLDLLILDGDRATEHVRGWRADCQLFSGTEDQNMTSALYVDFSIEPTDSDNEPKVVKVAAGGILQYSTPGVNGATFA